jgi:hypothetical protein
MMPQARRLVEHDSTEENLRTLGGWLERHERPLALYTDKNSLFVTTRPVQWQEQLRDSPARTQFGHALQELDIEWIAAHSPRAKGRIQRLFGALQDRLAKEIRLAGRLEGANRFLEITYLMDAVCQEAGCFKSCRAIEMLCRCTSVPLRLLFHRSCEKAEEICFVEGSRGGLIGQFALRVRALSQLTS